MTKQVIEACVRKWQDRLNLGNWDITVEFERSCPDEGTYLEVSRARDYLDAEIILASNWRSWTPAKVTPPDPECHDFCSLDRSVAHELIHIFLHDVQNAKDLIPFGALPGQTRDILDSVTSGRVERATEELAKAFCMAYGEK